MIAAEMSPSRSTGTSLQSVLQWSRGVIAAEIGSARVVSIVNGMLQWSRGVIAAEMTRTWTWARTGRACFNGAAA